MSMRDKEVRAIQRLALLELREKWVDELERFEPGAERNAYLKAFLRAHSNATRALDLEAD